MERTLQSLLPRESRDRLDHARHLMEILEASAYGLTIDECMNELYQGNQPTGEKLNHEREEIKRSFKYINGQFNRRVPGWVWIRTRRRPPRDWVYMAVAKMAKDEVVRLLDAAVSVESYERYERDWQTRTETLTRMQVLDIFSRHAVALATGDKKAAEQIESELDEPKIISPRLGLLYFGAGLADENLEILESDRRAWLYRRKIKRVREAIKRFQRATADLAQTLESNLQIRGLLR